jgi:Mg2+/citrate symporter
MSETDTMTDRIRDAEARVAKARSALEKAETGLRAAEKVAETADEVRSRPVLASVAVLLTLGLVVLLVMALRSSGSED